MASNDIEGAVKAMFPMITERLKKAYDIAEAATACARTNNLEGAFRILLDVEQHTFEATTLLNAVSLISREDAH